MNTSVSRFHGARRVRGSGLPRRVAIGAAAMVLAITAFAARSDAYLIRIDGDYLYMTEDFESVEGDTADLGFAAMWGNGIAVDSGDLWNGYSHDLGLGYGEVRENPAFFPYLTSGYANLQFALVDSEMPPGYPGERNDGWGLLLRGGFEDVVTFQTQWEVLEFSCDVFLCDTFSKPSYDSHAIDFIGTEGRLRYFLRFDEMTQHIVVTKNMFGDLIGDLEAVRLESQYAVFDNLTVKTWVDGPPGVPEPSVLAFLASGCLLFALGRGRRGTQ